MLPSSSPPSYITPINTTYHIHRHRQLSQIIRFSASQLLSFSFSLSFTQSLILSLSLSITHPLSFSLSLLLTQPLSSLSAPHSLSLSVSSPIMYDSGFILSGRERLWLNWRVSLETAQCKFPITTATRIVFLNSKTTCTLTVPVLGKRVGWSESSLLRHF